MKTIYYTQNGSRKLWLLQTMRMPPTGVENDIKLTTQSNDMTATYVNDGGKAEKTINYITELWVFNDMSLMHDVVPSVMTLTTIGWTLCDAFKLIQAAMFAMTINQPLYSTFQKAEPASYLSDNRDPVRSLPTLGIECNSASLYQVRPRPKRIQTTALRSIKTVPCKGCLACSQRL